MSPTSYQTAPLRAVDIGLLARSDCEADAVVATDSASADADRDNGAELQGELAPVQANSGEITFHEDG